MTSQAHDLPVHNSRRPWHWVVSRRPGSGLLYALFALVALRLGPAHRPTAQFRAEQLLRELVVLALLAGLFSAGRWCLDRYASPGDPSVSDRIVLGLLAPPRWHGAQPRWVTRAVVGSGVLLTLGVYVGPGLTRLVSPHQSATNYNTLPLRPSTGTLFAFWISSALLSPIVEEVVFRGGVQSFLGTWCPRAVSMLATSTLFAAFHGATAHGYSLAQQILVGLDGLWFGLLYEVTGSVLPGIAAHVSFNLVNGFAQTRLLNPYVAGPALLAVAGAALVAGRRVRRAQEDSG